MSEEKVKHNIRLKFVILHGRYLEGPPHSWVEVVSNALETRLCPCDTVSNLVAQGQTAWACVGLIVKFTMSTCNTS